MPGELFREEGRHIKPPRLSHTSSKCCAMVCRFSSVVPYRGTASPCCAAIRHVRRQVRISFAGHGLHFSPDVVPELPGLGSPAIEPRALKEPLAIHSEYTPYRSFLNANQAQRKAGTNNFVSQERIVKVEVHTVSL